MAENRRGETYGVIAPTSLTPAKRRHWYNVTRVQGALLTVAGIAMALFPPTHPLSSMVVAAGLGMFAGGVNASVTRKVGEK